MRRARTLTALAALASATLFLSLSAGVAALPAVAYFVQLPLLFIGLTLGLNSGAIASFGALAIVLLFGGGAAAVAFLVIELAPALFILRQALLSRTNPDGTTEWYPPGLIIAQLAALAAGLTLLALLIVRLQTGDVSGAFESGLSQVLSQFGVDVVSPEMESQLKRLTPLIPGIVATSWLLMMALNTVLAQYLARRTGGAQRPSPEFKSLWLPVWCGPAFAAAIILSIFARGDLAFFADSAALILAVPYLFQGLAVLHTVAGRTSSRRLMLFFIYIMLVLFSWPIAVFIIGLGLVDEWAHLRRRLT